MDSHQNKDRVITRTTFPVLGFILCSAISVFIIMKVSSYPFLIAFVLLACYGATVSIATNQENIKLFSIYFTSVILAFGLAEAFYSKVLPFQEQLPEFYTDREVIYGLPIQGDSILGYVPGKNSRWVVRKYSGDSLLYQKRQTFNEFGWRVNTDTLNDIAEKSAIFLGCSFTFGVGLEDDETLASYFQEATNFKYRSFNFAFEGYGPHQALAILENKIEAQSLGKYHPEIAVLQVIPDHIYRIKGKSGWDNEGPEYKLTKDGTLEYQGSFNSKFSARLKKLAMKSFLYKSAFLNHRTYDENDIELLGRIIKKTSDIFEQRYGGDFYVILWEEKDGEEELFREISAKLTELEVILIEIPEILPDFYPDSPEYFIRGDNHPNSMANEKISEYLSAEVVRNHSN